MKKVGIITYHHYYNYGTVLQAYALQKAIELAGDYSSEIIDYRAAEEKKLTKSQLLGIRIKRIAIYLKEWRRIWRLKRYGSILSEKNTKFDEFFNNELKVCSDVYYSYSDLRNNAPLYDVYVTGSDQTWSPKIGLIPAMFLQFAPKGNKRVAYAPSIGVSNLTGEEKTRMDSWIQGYSSVSCREKGGVALLQSFLKNQKVQLVVDPTLLLTQKNWDEIAINPKIEKPYILCYFIGHRSYYREYARHLSIQQNMPLFFIPVSWVDLINDNDFVKDAGPKEFLGLIKNASLVLTDSFHGTIFSINYHKDFYSFLKVEGGSKAMDNSRITDILTRFNLSDRLIDEGISLAYSPVDYTLVSPLIEKELAESWAYLKESLS